MGGNMKENSFARFILVLLAVIALWCIAIFHFDTETESNTEKIQGKLERLDLDQEFGRNSFAQFWINGRAYYCLLPSRQDREAFRQTCTLLSDAAAKDETLTVTYTEELGLQYIVSFVIWSRQAVAISSPEQEILPLALHNQREKEFRRFYMIIAGILTLALLADLRYSAWGIKRRQTKTRQKNRTRREEQNSAERSSWRSNPTAQRGMPKYMPSPTQTPARKNKSGGELRCGGQ